MKSIISIISGNWDKWDLANKMVHFISFYGQLFLSLFILISLFLFYEFFLQEELAKLLPNLDFRPPAFTPH